jgi:hypothetical protein
MKRQTKERNKKPYRLALFLCGIIPCFVTGAYLSTYVPKAIKEEKKEAPVTRTETKRENPLSAYGFSPDDVVDKASYRTAGKTLLSETIGADDTEYLALLDEDDPTYAYRSILSSYRLSSGIAQKAFDLSPFPADDGYYDEATLNTKTTLSASIQDDLTKGKYKDAYLTANTLTSTLSNFVKQKQAAEAAAKAAAEEAARQKAEEEQRQAEEQQKQAEQERIQKAEQEIESLYEKIPEKARQTFQNAGGSISILPGDQFQPGEMAKSDLSSRTIYINRDSYDQKSIDIEFVKQYDDLTKASESDAWGAALSEAQNITKVDASLAPATDNAFWFEEAGVLYLTNHDAFQNACPNTAHVLDSLFVG